MTIRCSIAVLLVIAPLGCAVGERPPRKVVLPDDNVVLAEVGGAPITRYDLERTLKSTLGEGSGPQLGEQGRKKLLESLVQSKAISQAREEEMSATELAQLDKKVAAYREDLLVKQYLSRHTRPRPLTEAKVKAYYEQHAERFGGKQVRSYELIATTAPVAAAGRKALMAALSEAKQQADWAAAVKQLQTAGHRVELRRGTTEEAVLHTKLRSLLQGLPLDRTSDLTFVEGRAYVARITQERAGALKPLSEVSAEIRRTLAPAQLKHSVKQAAEQVMKDAKVSYR